MALLMEQLNNQGKQLSPDALAFERWKHGEHDHFARIGVAETISNHLPIR